MVLLTPRKLEQVLVGDGKGLEQRGHELLGT